MQASTILSPKTGRELVDAYFIENRTRLLDVAAFLDRLDRAAETSADGDYRMRAFREALRVLSEESYPRTERIQMIMSDPTTEPLEALHEKGASGAYDHWQEESR